MKITKFLPKKLAIGWHEYSLNKLQTNYEYHSMMANGYSKLIKETTDELTQLRREL